MMLLDSETFSEANKHICFLILLQGGNKFICHWNMTVKECNLFESDGFARRAEMDVVYQREMDLYETLL